MSVANCMTDGLLFTLRALRNNFCTAKNINSCSHCTGATFETEQKPIRYSVNKAKVILIQFEEYLENMTENFKFKWSLEPKDRQQFSLNRQECLLLKML